MRCVLQNMPDERWSTCLLEKAAQHDCSDLYYQYDDAHRLADVIDKVDTNGNFTGNWVHYTLDNAGNLMRNITPPMTP